MKYIWIEIMLSLFGLIAGIGNAFFEYADSDWTIAALAISFVFNIAATASLAVIVDGE